MAQAALTAKPIATDSMEVLKRLLVPTGRGSLVSPNVLENEPSLALPQARTQGEAESNDQLKRFLGLESSPLLDQQRKDLTVRDEAINAANISATPEVSAQTDRTQRDKLALAGEPNRVEGAGNLAVEELKTQAAADIESGRRKQVEDLLQGQGGGTNAQDAPFKMSINAQGQPTFAPNQMPAMIQRSYAQLSDAKIKTDQTLAEAERLYPGILEAADSADTSTASPGWMDVLTGNAGKYGGASDLAGAANERLKYTVGVQTPFSNLAQSASFGNIEQMAGQMPGIRGLTQIMPMFKEHQSRWGKETPLATVQRLKHMSKLMDDSLVNMKSGEGVSGGAATADAYADPNYQPR
jgi:hypothetical protein